MDVNEVSTPVLNVHCRIRHQADILRTCHLPLPLEDIFVFQIKVKDMIGLYQFRPEGQTHAQQYILEKWEHNSPHLSQNFVIPFRTLAGNGRNCARHVIHELLGEVGIPRQKRRPLLGMIYSEAMRLQAKESDGDGEYKRIPIVVELRRVCVRTTVSNGVELERVRVEETEVCLVCLEEMEVGSEGSMMPCKHIFHGSCIYAWLKTASLCPLCRFQLS